MDNAAATKHPDDYARDVVHFDANTKTCRCSSEMNERSQDKLSRGAHCHHTRRQKQSSHNHSASVHKVVCAHRFKDFSSVQRNLFPDAITLFYKRHLFVLLLSCCLVGLALLKLATLLRRSTWRSLNVTLRTHQLNRLLKLI